MVVGRHKPGKALLLGHLFSQNMKMQDPDKQTPSLSQITDSILESVLVSQDAVIKHLRGVNTQTASGPDGGSPHLIWGCSEELTSPLTQIFQLCLRTGVMPTQ